MFLDDLSTAYWITGLLFCYTEAVSCDENEVSTFTAGRIIQRLHRGYRSLRRVRSIFRLGCIYRSHVLAPRVAYRWTPLLAFPVSSRCPEHMVYASGMAAPMIQWIDAQAQDPYSMVFAFHVLDNVCDLH